MSKGLGLVFTTLFILSTTSFAGDKHHEMPPAKTNKDFDHLKKLVGTWEGKHTENGKEETVTISYELTSGGNALIERLGVGTDHEMISVYYPSGNTVKMTHYCMVGNQPVLTLKNSTENEMSFEMKGKAGITSLKEMHMHALNIKWNGPEEITQDWTSYNQGKKQSSTVFSLARK